MPGEQDADVIVKTKIKALVVAGTHSGVGKTTITLGLLAALKRRGLRVASFKVGPDFIDPGHHRAVTGRVSRNLDGWMLSQAYNRACFARHAAEADLAVVEGVMGVFDGFSGRDESGSTAQMAKWLGVPVLLVINAASMARSAAALVQGFENFDPHLSFIGVLFNNLGSSGHFTYLQEALEDNVRMPCLGGLLRDEALKMPERHLGLVTNQDHPMSEAQIDLLARWMERHLDLDQLLDCLPEVNISSDNGPVVDCAPEDPVRIAVARDAAFCFYYQDNLDLLAEAGAELVPFSPMADRHLPDQIDGIYLGGGYPELHAAALAQNTALREAIRNCSIGGMPIYGECGGFMYLCRELADPDGRAYPMADCFPFSSRMHRKLSTLGYREITLSGDSVIGAKGGMARGHEFHYSNLQDPPGGHNVPTIYHVTGRKGRQVKNEGYRKARTLASYIHLHFGSNPRIAPSFVQSCRIYGVASGRLRRPQSGG